MEDMETHGTSPDRDTRTEEVAAHSEPVSHDVGSPEDPSLQSEGTESGGKNGHSVRLGDLGGELGGGSSSAQAPTSRS